MATIGRLTVALSANSAQLAQDLDKARKNYQGWTSQIEKRAKHTAKVIGGIATAAAAAFAAAGAAGLLMINRQAAEIDKMYKQASNLRLDLGDFQRLGFIAEQSGNSVDQLGSALNRMNMALAQETTLTVDALAGIGLSISEVMAMRPGDRFQAIAEAIRNTGDEAAQTRAQVALFGRAGGNMLNLINADFESLNAQFERMGITLTNAQGDMVAAYQDAKNRLSTMFTGFKQQFTAQMAGPLTQVTEWIESTALKMGGMDEIANKMAVAVVEGMVWMIEGIANMVQSLGDLELAMLKVLDKFEKFRAFNERYLRQSPEFADGLQTVAVDSLDLIDTEAAKQVDKILSETESRIKELESRDLANNAAYSNAMDLIDRIRASIGQDVPSAADDAANRINKMFGTSGDAAWDKIFGGPSNQENQRDYIPKAFSDAAKAFNDSLATGNMKTRETAMKDMQRLIDVAAGRRSETNFGSQRLSQVGDLSGMQSVFDRLQEMMPQEDAVEKTAEVTKSAILEGFSEGVQTLTSGVVQGLEKANEKLWQIFEGKQEVILDLRTDNGNLVGKVIGSREYIESVKALAAQAINNTARGVNA